MEILICPDREEVGLVAADVIARLVRRKPRAVLGLATGRTPLPLYQELVRRHQEAGLDFSGVTTFNLDEYYGLPPDHPCSYHHFMRTHFFDHVNIRAEQTFIPDGQAPDVPAFCRCYEKQIREAGGIDLQLLGIGLNGHIGFNEPSSPLDSRTRLQTLSPETIQANAVDFGGPEKVPRQVITMGIGTILESRQCLLLAFGERKAGIVAKAIEGPVTTEVPASALQLHPRVVVVLDHEAGAQLQAEK